VGWYKSLWVLAVTTILALLPLFTYRENQETAVSPTTKNPAYFQKLLSFFHRPGVWQWLFFIWLYVTGTSIASSMFGPLLVDLELSLGEIGWMTGIVGSGAAIVGSFLAGGLIEPLGRRRALVVFGLLQAITVLALILPAIGITDKSVLYLVASGELFGRSLASTALFTVMMDKSRSESVGSDYTLQSSAYMIGHHVGIPAFSGFIASSVGYTGVFSISFVFCLLGTWLATKVKCN
jgi:predicted MFS family arabinose efflux permease